MKINIALSTLVFMAACTSGHMVPKPQKGTLFNHTTYNVNCGATNDGCVGKQLGQKTGQACSHAILLRLISWGDMSVPAAAADGGITQIDTINVKHTSLFSLFALMPYTEYVGGDSGLLYDRKCLIITGQ
ncbi:MAG: hypothetical protein HS115_05020 [Spirochaetales bacterium]|nr:hypothetical protein [Spirochaetales bacterium]